MTYLYLSLYKDGNEIPTAIPMLSGSGYPMGIVAMLYDQTGETGNGKSQMATSKLEQDSNETPKATPTFSRFTNTVELVWTLSDIGNSKMAAITGCTYEMMQISAFI